MLKLFLKLLSNKSIELHTFLFPLDGDALAVLTPPDDLGRGEAVGPARHVDVLVLAHRHRRGRALDVQDVGRH